MVRFPGATAVHGGIGGEPGALRPWSSVVLRLVGITAAMLVPCVVIASVLCQGSEATRLWWLSETGPVEQASGWGYLLVATGLLTLGAVRLKKWMTINRGDSNGAAAKPRSEAIWYPMVLGSCVAAMGAREFDWHNIWTTRGVLKTRFYVDPAISIGEKVVVLAVLIVIGFLIATAVRAYGPRFLDQLRRGRRAAWLIAMGLALAPLSKSLDSGPSIYRRLFGDVPNGVQNLLGSVEEIMELAIPTLFLIAMIATFWSRRSGTACDDAEQDEVAFQSQQAA